MNHPFFVFNLYTHRSVSPKPVISIYANPALSKEFLDQHRLTQIFSV
jgi:hypothetical protein